MTTKSIISPDKEEVVPAEDLLAAAENLGNQTLDTKNLGNKHLDTKNLGNRNLDNKNLGNQT